MAFKFIITFQIIQNPAFSCLLLEPAFQENVVCFKTLLLGKTHGNIRRTNYFLETWVNLDLSEVANVFTIIYNIEFKKNNKIKIKYAARENYVDKTATINISNFINIYRKY